MDLDYVENLKRYFAEKIRIVASSSYDMDALTNLKFDVRKDLWNSLRISLETHIWGMDKERIDIYEKWPETWWDAFKDRWFPGWALRRWPAKFREIHIDRDVYGAVCPHLAIDTPGVHLEWMARQSKENRDGSSRVPGVSGGPSSGEMDSVSS